MTRTPTALAFTLALFSAMIGWAQQAAPGGGAVTKPLDQVIEAHTETLLAVPGVVGVAQGLCRGEPCIRVFVEARTPAIEAQLPAAIEGYPVVVSETGVLRPIPEPPGGGQSM